MSEHLHSVSHPDADRLSAFMEGALTEPERQECLAHLADCAECRDVVFLAHQTVPTPAPEAAALPAWRRWWPSLSLATAAACCALIAILWLRPHPRPGAEPSAVAVNHPVEPPPAAVAPPEPAAGSRQKLVEKGAAPPPRLSVQAPAAPPSGNGLADHLTARSAQLAAKEKTPAMANDQAQAAPPAGAETGPATAGAAAGAAIAPQQDRKAAALRAQAANEIAPAPQAPTANGALAQAQPLSGSLTASGALHLTIEHNQGPDNGLSAIHGTITDASGATIPQASIMLRASSGATAATATSDALGRFEMGSVSPGQYELQISARGFKTDSERLDLQARDLAVLSPALEVGAAAETVEVTSDARDIATTSKPTDAELAAIVPVLPGKLPSVATAVGNGRILALDTGGTLYLSRDAGRRWKKIRPVWTGSVAHLAVAEPAERSAFKKKEIAGTASPLFELTTTDGAVWISSDGTHWRLR